MRFPAAFNVLGLLLMIFSISMLPPIGVSWWYHDGSELSFLIAFGITFGTGVLLRLLCRRYQHELKTRDGFLIVVLFWLVLSFFGSIPFLIDMPHMSLTDAIFEATSGLTTTGATVITHIEKLQRGVLYYRQQLHLLGGMGIIVLAVAILPMLGIGGLQLYRAETVGPVKTTKLRPRMTQTAKALWSIYVGLVILCALCYWIAGMKLFDAIGESFSTLSTGGFSIYDASFAHYHSIAIDVVGIIFMLLGATNFGLHFQAIRYRRLGAYFKDPEFKAYIKLILLVTVITVTMVLLYHKGHGWLTFLHSLFMAVSLGTTTGLTTDNFSMWPTFVPYLLLLAAVIGGCGASTSGGIKVIRAMLLRAQGRREIHRLIHPQAVVGVRLGEESLTEDVFQSIWAFLSMFIAVFIILFLGLMATGLDLKTSVGALMSCISNTGASIGKVATTYQHIPAVAKWILIVAMLAGRLEIFTLLVIFTPAYWRK